MRLLPCWGKALRLIRPSKSSCEVNQLRWMTDDSPSRTAAARRAAPCDSLPGIGLTRRPRPALARVLPRMSRPATRPGRRRPF
jgi:hypothetical protein